MSDPPRTGSAAAPGGLRAWLEGLWWRPADLPLAPRLLLGPLAALYRLLLRVRHAAYRSGRRPQRRLPVPTLVVGNRIVGGAGKTPCTLALIDGLRRRGWHPGVVSRGFGREGDAVRSVDVRTSTATEVGDEPLLIARRSAAPVWVGRHRQAAGLALLQASPEVDLVICDDGLQHLSLARDLELVLFDERGAGNGRLLPLGPLREPLDTPSLARRQWTVHNRGDRTDGATGWTALRSLAGVVPLAAWWSGTLAPEDHLDWAALRRTLGTEPVVAVAGIGEPERFFRALEAAGLSVQRRACADHADHRQLPFGAGDRIVIVTEKDAVKLDPARIAAACPQTRVWVAPLVLHLPDALLDEIDQALRALAAPPASATPRSR